MPKANYCRKCKAEVPDGEGCPYCGGKLTRAGERISFGATAAPVRDWFAWNSLLRVALAPLALVVLAALIAELAAGGAAGAAALLRGGFAGVMLSALAVVLLLIFVVLLLQGRESVHYVLDKDGVRALCYLVEPRPWQLYARMVTPASVQALNDGEDALEGYTLVRRVAVPWVEVRRMGLWRENMTLLFYRPAFWLALAVRCPPDDFAPAEDFARKKLKRFKKVVAPAKVKKT